MINSWSACHVLQKTIHCASNDQVYLALSLAGHATGYLHGSNRLIIQNNKGGFIVAVQLSYIGY